MTKRARRDRIMTKRGMERKRETERDGERGEREREIYR